MSKRRVAYYYDPDIGSFSYGLGHPMKPLRMRITHNLVAAYNMLPGMDVIRPHRASPLQMTRFHTDEFVDFLHRVTPETAMDMTGGGSRFLTGEDNPAFDGLFEFCSISAGGSLAAADRINTGMADIAINWAGGLHHAKRGEASGFCYINDIVLAILELLRLHTRVLYIDIDFHHGDGVEEAFYTTDRVLTCSFHKQKDCFPGTGKVEDRGLGKGKGYAVNVPFLQGVTDEDFKSVFEPVIQYVLDWYRPDAVVLQCGADSLSGDKLGSFNLSMNGHADCVRFLRKANVPLVLLGGGGYTVRNVSCVWTYETACAIGIDRDLDPNLPYNEYLEWFGPRYRLEVQTNNMSDENVQKNYLESTKQAVLENLRDLPFAPSVQTHETPRHTAAQSMGLTPDDPLDEDELDIRIRRMLNLA
ncbi:histone deacetylase complex, catalytic component RPD3 [Cantharellus anzutake]|uniref:histone deacetylase complex, catalytic component RPD3 n=1 Tax=Cantharellus anzutake TaxID=1750568 RepID=UPI0019051B6B|nr:histone deacetylase complex, catalytic component RPD3 [Cantharellus anzutake]KAF8324582.1 histone deacetylase complex, catalytic component RPD3 [Cantharellus anzutake]